MDPLTIGALALTALLALLALGVPVAVGLGGVGVAGMWLCVGQPFALAVARTLPFGALSGYAWAVLPLFVLMGSLAAAARLTEDVFDAAEAWLGRMRGGMYMAVIAGAAAFAAASGSTIVNAVVFTRLALPRMLALGYSRTLSIGAITAAGTFAAMIPPSLTMVIYAIMTEQSVGRLLMAGVVPGLITAALYAAMVALLVRLRPSLAPAPGGAPPTLAQRLRASARAWGMALVVVLVLGGIYSGSFAPSAAGAVGAAGAFALALWRLGPRGPWVSRALRDSASISCTLLAIIVGGLLFSRFLVAAGVVDAVVQAVAAHVHSATGLMLLLCALYLALGCFIDTASMMIVTLPFTFPLVRHYGIDPIWFGVVFAKLIEIAVVTPPMGLNLFAAMSASKGQASFRNVALGVLPFVAVDTLVLALLVAFPWLATGLGGRM